MLKKTIENNVQEIKENKVELSIMDEEISLDNIHFGTFINSLNDIKEDKKIISIKNIKKIKIGKNKKISTEVLNN
jgi:hypothetical protein